MRYSFNKTVDSVYKVSESEISLPKLLHSYGSISLVFAAHLPRQVAQAHLTLRKPLVFRSLHNYPFQNSKNPQPDRRALSKYPRAKITIYHIQSKINKFFTNFPLIFYEILNISHFFVPSLGRHYPAPPLPFRHSLAADTSPFP